MEEAEDEDEEQHKIEYYKKKKVGRPFKGIVEGTSKEPNVPERRSILRGFKKYYSKKEKDEESAITDILDKISPNFSPNEKVSLRQHITMCRMT
eukprot:CAMPEP_0170542040 /NCGR_PEP_ID=MMETSP0211-20121228/1596_1 /TAXON_ID=311385 /ORGANISM="Pseudokeronopsis sp., Strain OXSARD2" /LENGTH=93 /DNA_ID=CAMNT_0010844979 /DNA_START=621 /DNA_END=902 /DNA_ORIENTATION=-